MSGDFGIFDDELKEVPMEMDDFTDYHTTEDIESVLDTMRHLPENELEQIRQNLQRSLPENAGNIDEAMSTTEFFVLNGITFVVFFAFGKR